jgi:hypothetical protein
MRLMPLMCLLNGLNFVGRVSMGWAVLFSFKKHLGLVGDQYSWASSIFYFGLRVSQYPSNYLLQQLSTPEVVGSCAMVWGVMMLAIIGCKSFAPLMVVRFLLGCAEAGVSPALVYYTSVWYTKDEQVIRTSIRSMVQGLLAILGALIPYGRKYTSCPARIETEIHNLLTNNHSRPYHKHGTGSLEMGFPHPWYSQLSHRCRVASLHARISRTSRVVDGRGKAHCSSESLS